MQVQSTKTKELRKVLKDGKALGEHLGIMAALKKFALLDQFNNPIEGLAELFKNTDLGLKLSITKPLNNNAAKSAPHYLFGNGGPLGSGVFDRPESYGGV